MKNHLLFTLFFLTAFFTSAQDDGRVQLRGQVLYRGNNVVNENVINSTSEMATITNEDGQFNIRAKVGDQLVFTAVNYQLEIIKVTEEILANKRLVVEVTEKVTALDEVVVSPENQEKFIALQNEEFKRVEYEIDRTSGVENIAETQTVRGMRDGINFVNIFKAIFKAQNQGEEERPPLKMSEVLRQVYDDEFFVVDLKLPQESINAFLFYCDEHVESKDLLKKENEFQLIDFLVTQSKAYRATLDEE